MTPCPRMIADTSPVDEAVKVMELQHIRHLPVTRNGELLGVLSEVEARLASVFATTKSAKLTAGEVCEKEPYIVSSDTLISSVALEMADRHIECVLVADEHDHVAGIFTTSDACRYIHYLTSEK